MTDDLTYRAATERDYGHELLKAPHDGRVFFAGDLGFKRLKGYSHDLRQIAHARFCDPAKMSGKRRDCTPIAGGKCRAAARGEAPRPARVVSVGGGAPSFGE